MWRGWEKIPEATQFHVDPALGGGRWGEVSAGSLGARDAYSQECAGGSGRTRLSGPLAPPQCGSADLSSLRLPPSPP